MTNDAGILALAEAAARAAEEAEILRTNLEVELQEALDAYSRAVPPCDRGGFWEINYLDRKIGGLVTIFLRHSCFDPPCNYDMLRTNTRAVTPEELLEFNPEQP